MTNDKTPVVAPNTDAGRREIEARGNTVKTTNVDGKPAVIDGPRSSFAPPQS
jgi:hypothetical protein